MTILFGRWLEANIFIINWCENYYPSHKPAGLQISESLCFVYTTGVDSPSAGLHDVRLNLIFQMQQGIRDLY